MSGNPISRIVIVVATAAVLLAGCCPDGGSNWQKIAAGEMVNKEDVDETNLRPGDIVYLGYDPRLIVIGDAVEVPSLRDRVLPSHLERIAEVDFSAYFVAVIHQGLRNRPYHPIEVNAVEFEDNVFTIHAKLYEPDRSTYEPFPANSPYYVSSFGLKCTSGFHRNCTRSLHPKCTGCFHPNCTSDLRPKCTTLKVA